MILPIDTYYQAAETEARLAALHPRSPRRARRSAARRAALNARNAIGHALIGLGRLISAEPAGKTTVVPR